MSSFELCNCAAETDIALIIRAQTVSVVKCTGGEGSVGTHLQLLLLECTIRCLVMQDAGKAGHRQTGAGTNGIDEDGSIYRVCK